MASVRGLDFARQQRVSLVDLVDDGCNLFDAGGMDAVYNPRNRCVPGRLDRASVAKVGLVSQRYGTLAVASIIGTPPDSVSFSWSLWS